MSLRALYELPAPAKLNLFLHIVGRRRDGYHLLESVFVPIDWCDTLHLEWRSDGRIHRHDLGSSLPEDDLCLRAARALQQASGTRQGADIHIDKRVPAGAGMGGGSSDAATVLLGLNRLWGLGLTRAQLMALALPLGADVPFFVFGQPALVQGIGEQISALPLPPRRYAVLKPHESLPTGRIFGSEMLERATPSVIVAGSLDATTVAALDEGFGRNDLEPVAKAESAEVAQALHRMATRFGNSRMTGSGSAVFSRVGTDNAPAATWPEDGADALPEGWVAKLCRSLPRHPLADWVA